MSALLQNPVAAAPPPDGAVEISPYDPVNSWMVDWELLPDESVNFTVTVLETGNSGGTSYVMEGAPTITYSQPNTLWTKTTDASPYVFKALNSGVTAFHDTVTVSVVWKEQITPPEGGGGGGGEPEEPDTIDGSADGTVYSEIPVFAWSSINPNLQHADGESPVNFTVTGSVGGAAINLAGYTVSVSGQPAWTVAQNANGNAITGTVKSSTPGEGNLKIKKGSVEDTDTKKIGFAKVDLAISGLTEDRHAENTPHEMDPGGVVLAAMEGDTTTFPRTKLTLTGNSQNPGTNGEYVLSQAGLTKVEIYDAAVGGNLIPLDKTWQSGEFGASKTLYVASQTFGEDDEPENGTLKLTYKCALNGANEQLEDEVTVNLLPVELSDVNGDGDSDDVRITPWDTSQDIANNNIALIDAHQSAQNAAPRMPQLEFRVPGMPDGLTIEAKLNVQYTRGNGERVARNQAEDRVRIPVNGNFAQVNGDTWQLYSEADWQTELTERGFFGGEATLTYQIKQGANIVVGPEEIDFRIGGENPDDARSRAYIENRPNAGAGGNLWFAYAIAKSESRDYNGEGSRYNQFLELPTHHQDVGKPLWGNDGGTIPGGYGMFQVTGNVSDSTANIPRREIWDWRENVHAGLSILASKRTTADAWMTQQKNAQNANGTALPNHTVRTVTFAEGTNRTMNDAVTIKLYNGASRPPDGTDNGNVPGFLLHNGSGHYCFWRNASNEWALNRYNNPPPPIDPFNYVDRVCQEVEN